MTDMLCTENPDLWDLDLSPDPERAKATCMACPAVLWCVAYTTRQCEQRMVPEGVVQAGVVFPEGSTGTRTGDNRTMCNRGHALTEENTKVSTHRGRVDRECRTCIRASDRATRARRKQRKMEKEMASV